MAVTRPYKLVYKGEPHIIDAPNAALAVQHVVGADISELRHARAAEVSAWVRAGNPIPIANAKTVLAVDGATSSSDATATEIAAAQGADVIAPPAPTWDGTDARTWLIGEPVLIDADDSLAIDAWDAARAEGRMTLVHFDIIRSAIPSFADAIAAHGAAMPAENVEQVRASLEENPMAFADVVDAVGAYARVQSDVFDGGQTA